MNKKNNSSFKYYLKLTALVSFFILLGIFLNFPFDKFVSIYSDKILNNPNCPVNVANHTKYFFPPGFIFKQLTIPTICSSNKIPNLIIPQLRIALKGPSLFPPGVRIGTKLQVEKSIFDIDSLITFSNIKIRVNKARINSQLINLLINQENLLKGDFKANALITLTNSFPSKGNFSIQSNNLTINQKTIMGFELPAMPIETIKLNGQFDKKNILTISNLSFGSTISPIIVRMKGTIELNKHNLMYSKLKLKGEIKFSPKFLKQISILNLFLSGKKKSNGYYSLKINGSLINPRPKIL